MKYQSPYGLTIALCIILMPSLYGQINTPQLDANLKAFAKETTIVGFGAAIINEEGLQYDYYHGMAARENKQPYQAESLQTIGSISKTMIGISLMKAQEMGLLSLDDPINKHLPFVVENPYFPNQPITIRHLATHSSTLKDGKYYRRSYIFQSIPEDFHKNFPWGIRRLGIKMYLRGLAQNQAIPMEKFLFNSYHQEGDWYRKGNFVNAQPGQQYEYSNGGATLAALILEKVTQMPFDQFVQTHITTPLKMKASSWNTSHDANPNQSRLYFGGHALPPYYLITYPDGGFKTSITDFSLYAAEIIRGFNGQGQLLTDSSYQEMLSIQGLPAFESGIFWDIKEKMFGHSGGDPGVMTVFYISKEKKEAYLVFANTSDTKHIGQEFNELFQLLRKHP